MSKEQWEVYIEIDNSCIGVLSTQHYRYDDVLLRISGNFKLDAEKINCARQIAFDLNEIERLRSEVAELKAERDKIESALKKMISMYIIDDYICGEDRESKIEDIFRRMMEESKS